MKRVLGAVAIAAVLALTGCAGHGRGNSGLSSTDQTHVTSGQPATSTTTTPPTVGAGNASTAARLTSIDDELNGIDSSLSSIDSNITAADKAGDDDN
jgi:hypothetical protein